ncbi:MAG: hypothetical protein Pg6C_00430 [Treponemataceae bacterium]|nr:MAG: hypothetical protein Pg6C_00430 [Treponemataceae bacterium]
MKTLHFDCFAGISGDMTLGAFIDLGVDPDYVRGELGKLRLDGWELEFTRDERCGITGTRARVHIEGCHHHEHHDEHEHHHDTEHSHEHHHDTEHEHPHTHHHEHSHHNEHGHEHHHGHEHRDGHHHEHSHNTWKEIRHVIEDSAITGGAKRKALDIFARIAAAESRVHGVALDDIAFHEVGALDSIIDIVGAAVCLDKLAPDRITAGVVELGGGTVHCAHGELPVPAPATLILCEGMPVHAGGFDKEMTTPTGAAILASQVNQFVTEESFTEIKTGYGIGGRKLNKPNVLRVSWRETSGTASILAPDVEMRECVLLEANIDDMTGEELGFLMECLFAEGARDVVFIPCVMKKNRPGTLVSVLAPPDKLDALRVTMFTKSKTIGFREIPARCFALRRDERRVGGAAAKTVYFGEKKLREKIEFEDRAKLAREKNIPLWDAEKILRGENE